MKRSPTLSSCLGLRSSSSVPAQACQSSGSRTNPGRSRGGLASVTRLVKLGRCKNVVVVAGAGISTASGIPDFRLPSGRFSRSACAFFPFFFFAFQNPVTLVLFLCFSELREQACMPTWSNTTSPTRRPSSTSITSPMTRCRSSRWRRLCIPAATGPTTSTTSSACSITKACCCACTRRTSTGWRSVSESSSACSSAPRSKR